jgi:hypothetical protein
MQRIEAPAQGGKGSVAIRDMESGRDSELHYVRGCTVKAPSSEKEYLFIVVFGFF